MISYRSNIRFQVGRELRLYHKSEDPGKDNAHFNDILPHQVLLTSACMVLTVTVSSLDVMLPSGCISTIVVDDSNSPAGIARL